MKGVRAIIWLAVLGVVLGTRGAGASLPFTIPDTQVLKLHSQVTGSDYQLFVATPSDNKAAGKAFPVVFMLDADYSFALVRNVVQHFVERNNLPPMILVAVAYPGAAHDHPLYQRSRTRDYTPTFVPDGGYGPEFQKYSGGGGKFAEFFASELIPFIEKRFPAAAHDDRTIIGHSYGGLFGAYVLLTRPELFQRYILISSSLWYDDQVALRLEETQAKSGVHLNAHVFLAAGALEDPVMAGDATTLQQRLLARHDEGLKVDSQIFDSETHNSVFPGAVTRGLLKVFDAFPARSPTRAPPPRDATPTTP
jgi:hypothetical protein